MRTSVRSLAILAVVAAALGCGGNSSDNTEEPIPFDQPDVALRDVKISGVGILGGSLQVVLHVYNPNGYALEAPRVAYRVYLSDVDLAQGITDLDVTVPARDSATVLVPASFSYLSIGHAGRALMNTGSAPYHVLGRITVGTPYGRLSFPYDRIGTFATLAGR